MTEKLVFSTCLFISRESRLESGVEPGSGIRSSYSVDGLVSYIRPVTLYLCLRNLVLCCVLCTGAYIGGGGAKPRGAQPPSGNHIAAKTQPISLPPLYTPLTELTILYSVHCTLYCVVYCVLYIKLYTVHILDRKRLYCTDMKKKMKSFMIIL